MLQGRNDPGVQRKRRLSAYDRVWRTICNGMDDVYVYILKSNKLVWRLVGVG